MNIYKDWPQMGTYNSFALLRRVQNRECIKFFIFF